ncbi:MAG: sigma-70 family RNA polymerase sigma factor [Candidatus Peribacteraceae bacterium]|jgi:RNA polymerase primary sigma factor
MITHGKSERFLPRSGSTRLRTPLEQYYHEIRDIPIPTDEEEQEWFRRYMEGDVAAGHHLVRSNLRLVADLAQKFAENGVPIEDLIQVGSLSLYKALENYNPRKNTRFSSFAYICARQGILDAIPRQTKIIAIPAYSKDLPQTWDAMRLQLQESQLMPPTEEDVARALGHTKNFSAVQMSVMGARLERVNGADAFAQTKYHEQAVRRPDDIVIEKDIRERQARFVECLMQVTLDRDEYLMTRDSFGFDDGEAKTEPVLASKHDKTVSEVHALRKSSLRRMKETVRELLEDEPDFFNTLEMPS